MPIKTVKTDLEWGQDIFIKNDPEQSPLHLVGLIQLPGGVIKFILSSYYDEDPVIKYDFECTTNPGEKVKPDEDE